MKTAALWVAIVAQTVAIMVGGLRIADELGYLHRYQVGLGQQIAP